jgi:hypothetical protein
LLVPLCLFLLACEPKWNLPPEDFDVVLTLYDPEADFGGIRTYAMPDTIVHLYETTGERPILSRQNDELILGLVAANMDSLGYIREYEPEEVRPDVLMLVSATSEYNYFHYSTFSWWGHWGWYSGAGNYTGSTWGWGFPWGRTYEFEVPAGTLFIDMLDFENLDWENEIIPIIWEGAINGVLDDTGADQQARLTELINRAFDQSPYLGAAWSEEGRLMDGDDGR